MKTVKNLWKDIITDENIEASFYEASKGKRKRDDVSKILNNIDYHVSVVKKMLIETTKNDTTKGYVPRISSQTIINEGSRKKLRKIDKPKFKYDQVVHHAVMRQLSKHIIKSMYAHVYGSVPKRGAHSGKNTIEKWLKNDVKGTKYCAKLDIRHFYESVNHDVIKKLMNKKIKDDYLKEVLSRIIDCHIDKTIVFKNDDGTEKCVNTGLPLGFYTSGWIGNWLLQSLDYFIKQNLRVKYYIRYMDDMVLFGPNKKKLRNDVKEIERFLNEKLCLLLKYNHQVFRFDCYSKKKKKQIGRPLDFMGFVFYRNRTVLRKSILLKITRKANKISKKKKVSWRDATSMMSYMGYISNTNSYNVFVEYIKPKVNIQELKRKISIHSKEVNENGMEKNRRR